MTPEVLGGPERERNQQMPSIQQVAPRDQTRGFVVRVDQKDSDGNVVGVTEVPVRYYPNRITLGKVEVQLDEDEIKHLSDDEIDALQSASTLCNYLEWWDMQGEFRHPYTGEVLVPAGEDIPLDPRIVQWISTPVISEFMRQLTEEVFPKQKDSRNERRRSHLGRVTPMRSRTP